MKWIGLTGGIGTGKSTVGKIIRDFGIPVVDADQLSRAVVQKGTVGLNEVELEFGPGILDSQGELDRTKLGQIIFGDEQKRLRLEKIIHPRVQKLKQQEKMRLEQEGHAIAFYDVPLLFEKNLQNDFDSTVLVYCSEEEQKNRIKARDGLSEAEAEKRIQSQIPIEKKRKRANHTIDNQGSLSQLKSAVEALLPKLQ